MLNIAGFLVLLAAAYTLLPVHGAIEWLGIVWGALILNAMFIVAVRALIHRRKGRSLNMKDDNWRPI
jgi:4-hydroxybenzoate polyprenyltransferase